MTDCNKRLMDADGAWIGTVAHIVSAEDTGPRADVSMSPELRRKSTNLMLLCADHGRKIDDRETGERDFPRHRLLSIKAAHEERFAQAISQMIESSRPKGISVEDFMDTSPGHAVPG
jgi:hypothetical protein